jgi:clan AA aspartic protease (TIGR02281 family)
MTFAPTQHSVGLAGGSGLGIVGAGWLLTAAAGTLLAAGAVGGICIYGQTWPIAAVPPPQITGHPPPADDRPQRPDPARQIVIASDRYHQFYESVTFVGPGGQARFQCLFDSGCSVTSLSKAQAAQLGYDRLNFSVEVSTANGRSSAAPVRLASLTIAGRYTVRDEPAWVAAGESDCLIGMSTLHFLNVEKPKNGPMTLSW